MHGDSHLKDRRRLLALLVIMACVAATAAIVSISVLYGAAFDEQRARLREQVDGQARLIEAVARFDAVHSRDDHPEGALGATLSQVVAAHRRPADLGTTGSFCLARREGDTIAFLLTGAHDEEGSPRSVPFDSGLAQPMRRALEGRSGTMIGLDARGVEVLAAYGPVEALDLGIVAKVDMAGIRAPFVRAAVVSGLATLVAIMAGVVLFHRVTSPFVMRLRTAVAGLANAQRIGRIGHWEWDAASDTTYWSDEVYRIFGFEPRGFEPTYQAFLRMVHPDDREMVCAATDKALYEGVPYSIDFRIVLADGGQRTVHEQGEVAYGTRGKLVRMSGTVQDITEQKRVQATLQKLSRIVEQSPTMIMITDTDGRIEYVNPKFTEVTGYAADEVVGRTPAILKSGTTPPHRYTDLWTTLKDGGEWRGDIQNRKKNGEHYWCRESVSPIRNADGEVTHFVAIVEDITESKQKAEELRHAKEQAELASRSKSEFLATMSHELRSPLNAIIGFAELMRNETFGALGNPKYRDYAQDVLDSGTHLLEVINDILDLSKIESGKLELAEQGIDMGELVETCQRLIRPRADQARLRLATEVRPDLPAVYADPRKIKQILLNLLSNAVKFTPEGGTVTTAARIDDEGRFVLSVADTGIGIAPEDIDKAVSAFGQVDSSLSRKYQGTGLGLPLSKALVELHGGTLTLESEPDVGTTVTVVLPTSRLMGGEGPTVAAAGR